MIQFFYLVSAILLFRGRILVKYQTNSGGLANPYLKRD